MHADEPIQGPIETLGVARRIAGQLHRPGDHARVVQVRIKAVRELKGPAAAGQSRATDAPVPGLIAQLLRAQPLERAIRCAQGRDAPDRLHRQARQSRIPDRRHAGLAIGARGVDHQQFLEGSFSRHAARVIARIATQYQHLERINHRREDGTEAILAVQSLEDPGFRAACGERAHGLRDQRLDQVERESIHDQKDFGENAGPFRRQSKVVSFLLRRRREQLGDMNVARIARAWLVRAQDEQWDHDGARPIRDPIDMEWEPSRHQHDLDRYIGHRAPGHLPE